MQIYLMRHGDAVPQHGWRDRDFTRPLAPGGKKQLERAVNEMKKAGFSVNALLSSPLTRAQQTAQVITNVFSELNVVTVKELEAGASAQSLRSALLRYKSNAPLWVIGHMPDFALFVARLLGDALVIERGFQPGEMCGLDVPSLEEEWGTARLLWWKRLEEWGRDS